LFGPRNKYDVNHQEVVAKYDGEPVIAEPLERPDFLALESVTLVVARDGEGMASFMGRLGGKSRCYFISDLDDLNFGMAYRACDLARVESDGPRFGAAVLVLAGGASPARAAALGCAGRRLVPDGPVVVVSDVVPASSELYLLMTERVDVCDRKILTMIPDRLSGLLDGSWPGVRHLHLFCRRKRLSPMETRAFLAACAGLSKVEAHEKLGCSIRTLESHWSRIFGKIGIRSTDGVISAALRDLVLNAGPLGWPVPAQQRSRRDERRAAPVELRPEVGAAGGSNLRSR
jgi:DNA-binding CsgD family transcriptional regulator